MKNKNEKRAGSKLIYRTEALHYGLQFVKMYELPNDDVSSEPSIFNNESNQMYVQALTVSEIDVSTLADFNLLHHSNQNNWFFKNNSQISN
jgi:hypothetical protein